MILKSGRGSRWANFLSVCLAVALSLCGAWTGRALGQQAVTSATLSGKILDADGASIPGAQVTITSLDTNQQQTAVSNAEGRYRFSYLPVGAYELKAEREGFNVFREQLTLTVGQALDVTVRLSVAGVTEVVNVTDDIPVIETVRTQVAGTIAPREIDRLPLNGRNYLDLALLVPGVSRTNINSNQRFAETSAVPGTGISVAGQRNLNNSFLVDGLSANDDAADLAGTFYSQDVIREFQVITSGGISEFGRASGGIVNIITQSGTNDWRGRLYGFFRNQRLDARNPLSPRKDPLTQAQYGASVGGPLRLDKTFLFANFEQTRRHDGGVITITPASVAAINARLDAVAYVGPRIQTGVYPSGYDVTDFFLRVDHKLNTANLLSARYNLYSISSPNARNVGGLNATSRGTALESFDQTATLSNVATLSRKTLNETRFQYTRSRLEAPVNDSVGPAVNISGVASFGTATFSPTARDVDLFQLVNTITNERGAHSLKAGADFLLNRANITFPGALQGVYSFPSLASFQAGVYTNFQQAFGAVSQFQSNPNLCLFVQDEWRARSDLTINAGVRYDAQFLPGPTGTDANNFAPRVGVAYAPGRGRTVVRASFGLYFDRIPLRATSNALQRDGSRYRVAVLSFGQREAPAFPRVLDSFPQGLLASVTTIDPQIKNGYSEQASLQIERALPGHASLSVGYLHLRGLHLLLSRNVNVPTAPASAGIPNLGRPRSDFANINRFESAGDSYYDGMTVSVNKQTGRWAQLRLSYTLSKAIDDAGNFFFSTPQDNFNLRDDRGLSDNDQRHRLTLSGSLEVPAVKRGSSLRHALAGLQLSYIFTYGSRLPFNIQTGNDRNFDTNNNDRPLGVGRNTGRGFDFASFDLRLSRKFRLAEHLGLETIVEGFNLLNRANLQIPNSTFGQGSTPLASFGRPNAAADARQFQLGLRFNF
ncbi:MAG TPA: carboxypeptidase regulatory-like domain-containing protein [Pyrinomonadaceae bacterium]